MLGGNVLILKIIGFLEGALEKLVHGLGKGSLCGTSAGDLGEAQVQDDSGGCGGLKAFQRGLTVGLNLYDEAFGFK